jgi:hypothetical protein
LQGSYGMVKLAYNEEDDTHYVSISTMESDFLESDFLESDFMKNLYLFIYLSIYFVFDWEFIRGFDRDTFGEKTAMKT